MKIGGYIEGVLIVGLISSLFVLWLANLNAAYSPSGYNGTSYKYSEFESIKNDMNGTRNDIAIINSPNSDVVDRATGFIGVIANAVSTLSNSVMVSIGIINSATQDAHLGESGNLARGTMSALVILGLLLALLAAWLRYEGLI